MATLSTTKLRDAMVGGMVADAATMPLHWLYDDAKIKALVGEGNPEFFEPPSCPFYSSSEFPGHYTTGQPSPYGEHGQFMLTYLAEKGQFDADTYVDDFRSFLKNYTGRTDHASKLFIENYDKGLRYPDVGAADNQANSFPRVAAVTALYGGTPQHQQQVEVYARAHQNDDLLVAVTHTLHNILLHVASGSTVSSAVAQAKVTSSEAVKAALDRVEQNLHVPTREFLLEIGKEIKPEFPAIGVSCGNPMALQGVVHILLTATSYEDGVRRNIVVGGDNASRSHVVGAVLGAAYGVPAGWRAKTMDIDAIEKAADAILTHRKAREE